MPTIFFDPRTDTKDVPANKIKCWDTLFAVMRIRAIPEFNGCSYGGTSLSDGVSGYITLCFVAALLPAKIIVQLGGLRVHNTHPKKAPTRNH